MIPTPESQRALPAFGMSSLVLGVIALLLSFLPILGLPISVFGLAFGIVGVVLAFFYPWSSLRWSLGGVAAAALALVVNLGILYAPTGNLTWKPQAWYWLNVPDRPFVPPPADPW